MVANTQRTKKTPPDDASGTPQNEMKVTTGSWWKSTVVETTEPMPDTLSEDTAAAGHEQAEHPEKPVRARTRGARRKKPVAKAEGETETGATKSPGRKPGRRPAKGSAGKKEAITGEADRQGGPETADGGKENEAVQGLDDRDAASIGVPSEAESGTLRQKETEVPQEKEEGASAVPVESGGPAEDTAQSPAAVSETAGRKKSGRSRRGKRGNKKHDELKEQAGSVPEQDQPQPEQETEATESREEGDAPKAKRKLLINAEEPEECRLALLEEGRLESIYVSTVTRTHTKNNIYKAKIVALEANLQAAFVDYGTEKNGFLPFGEIHPEYYRQEVSEKSRKLIEQHQWKKLSITDVLERGQEVLVQVVKEEIGTKGANMTTYLSLPGRCVVLLPGSDSSGISRKISGEERRGQLREIMESLSIPEGIGWIVRTASNDINKPALSRDVTYLLRLWSEVKKKGQEMGGVGLVYQDHDSVLRFLRENFDSSIEEILVDDEYALEQVKGFIELLPPKQRTVRVKLHRGSRPIFNQYSIEDQIESIYQPRVALPSGGSIVIDQTEALVAIDVNSGSTSKEHNFEASIFQANMEAASEFARQLRLRDLGGLIVVDFIDMRSQKNIREVEKQVKTAMKRDKAKVDISRISKFGLMQISRQKLGAPIDAGTYRVCEHCKGRGTVRSIETLALFYLRRIQTGASRKQVRQVECHFPLDVAQYLLNNKRQELIELEKRYATEVVILAESSLKPADHEIIYHKAEKEGLGKKQA